MGVQDLWYLKKKPKEKTARRSKRHGKGARWRVNWEDPYTGETGTLHFDTKPEAEAKWVEIQSSINRGTYTNPKAGLELLELVGDRWVANLVMRESSKAAIEGRWRNHVRPVLGSKPIGAVRASGIQYWVRSRQELKKPLAASTIRIIYHSVVHPLFAHALVDGAIGRNPCVGIRLPELPKGVYDLPTAEQVHAIAGHLPDRYKVVPYIAAGCGWRSGEIFGAEHADGPSQSAFNLLGREGTVRQQLCEIKDIGLCLAQPKSATSCRTNEVPEVTRLAIAAHIRDFPPVEVELLDRTNPDKPNRRTTRLLITDDQGRPMRRAQWSPIWNAAVVAAGLPRGMFTLRSLRHYFATVLIFDGASVKAVQLACGHATPTITLNTYLGYWPGDLRLGTRTLLDNALGQPICTGSVPAVGP